MSEEAYPETVEYFTKKGMEVIKFPRQNKPYEAVCHHPDMFMFYDEKLFVEPSCGVSGVKCELLGEKYPQTIKYNIAKVANSVICKYEDISDTVRAHIESAGYSVINVKQGYSKCSTAIVGHSIITSDKGIYEACRSQIDSLLIQSGHIELPGLDHGFIGGTCVSFDDTVFFNGDIEKHPDYARIKGFIEKQNMKIEYLKHPLMDIGSFVIVERSE